MADPPTTQEPTGAPPRRRRRRRLPVGASPGTLAADPGAPPSQLHMFAWDASGLRELRTQDFGEALALRAPGTVIWLDVSGTGDPELLRRVGEAFGLHRLALEDVTTSQQRAKVEEYPGHQFLVLRMVDAGPRVETEQFAICFGDGFVVTFQERPGDCFDPIRTRLKDPQGRLRNNGPDYLAYALLDAVVDAYFPAVESIGDRLEGIEDRVLEGREHREVVGDLHGLRRELLVLRRALWPLREATQALVRGETGRFRPETRVYLRDVHDHVVHLLDLVENYREMGASLMDLHLATISNRLGEVMKVLTLIATIFIPLTFVVGLYGMNFEFMPGLHWRYGFPVAVAVMATLASAMVVWFRRRRWL